jgi:hypothetical protein
MARVLTRPMFRKGGLSRETGIMSGLDRKGYAGGGNIGGGRFTGTPMGSRTGFQQLTFAGMEGPTQNVAKRTLMERLGGRTKGALDFFKRGFKRIPGLTGAARTGITSLAGYTPAGMTASLATLSPLAAAAASPFVAHYAAKGQRKKGMFTPEGESYDPETGKILGGPNVSELFFTEQELAGSDANIEFGTEEQMAEDMAKARDAKIKELQQEQISARIKRGDPVDANTAQELGVNLKTGAYDKGEREDPTTKGDKFTGDMESDLMKAYKEYAPLFEKELGVSSEDTKKQLYMQLAKFGTGLMAQPGGDLVGAIGKAAEKPLEGAGEVVKDVSTAKRQAKLLALQTAISQEQPGNVGKALKDIAKAYNVSMGEAADIYAKWQMRNTTAIAADVASYRKFAADIGANPEGFQRNIRALLADPELADLVGQFNQLLPDDIEDATNREYYITKQGQLVRVVDGEILTSEDAGFKDKPKKK